MQLTQKLDQFDPCCDGSLMFSVKLAPTFFTGSGRLALECPANISVVVKRGKFFDSFKLNCFFYCKSSQARSMLLWCARSTKTHPRSNLHDIIGRDPTER